MHQRPQTKLPLDASYNLHVLSPLLGWKTPFFPPFSFNTPETHTWLFHAAPRERQSGESWFPFAQLLVFPEVSGSHRKLNGQVVPQPEQRHKDERGCHSSSPQSISGRTLGHASVQPLAWCRAQGLIQYNFFKLESFSGAQCGSKGWGTATLLSPYQFIWRINA